MSNKDDFDSPELNDVDQNPDRDMMDFEEFEDSGSSKSAGSAWKDKPLFKFGLIGAAILVVVAVLALFGGKEAEAPVSVMGAGEKGFKEAPGTKEVTPSMKEALEEKNKQVVEEAQKTGGSAIATPIEPPKTLLEVTSEQTQTEDPLLRWQQMQEERAKAQRDQQILEQQSPVNDPQRETRLNTLVQSMSQAAGQVLSPKGDVKLGHMVVFEKSSVSGAGGGAGAGAGVAIPDKLSGSQPGMNKPVKVIVPAGKIEYAQMLLEANSDIPGPVLALIASGEFNGGKLIGKFSSQEEYLVITFSTLVTKKGTSIPVNAYAIDPNTSLTGVATDVDHRYFKRIVLPAAASFIEGLGSAYAETTTETSQSSTSTTTSTSDLNSKQEFGKAISEAASTVGDILSEDGKNTQPLVIVAAGTPLGILFMDSITDQEVLKARSGSSFSADQQQTGSAQPLNAQQGGFMNPMQQLMYGMQGQQMMQQGSTYNSPYNQIGGSGASSTNSGQ